MQPMSVFSSSVPVPVVDTLFLTNIRDWDWRLMEKTEKDNWWSSCNVERLTVHLLVPPKDSETINEMTGGTRTTSDEPCQRYRDWIWDFAGSERERQMMRLQNPRIQSTPLPLPANPHSRPPAASNVGVSWVGCGRDGSWRVETGSGEHGRKRR